MQDKPFKKDMHLVLGETYAAIESSGVLTPRLDQSQSEVEESQQQRLQILLKAGKSFLKFYPTQNHEYRQNVLLRASKAYAKAFSIDVSCCKNFLFSFLLKKCTNPLKIRERFLIP